MDDDIVVTQNWAIGKGHTVDDIVSRLNRHNHDWLPDTHTLCDYCDALYEIERLRRLIADWADADDNTKWEEVTTAEWYAACNRIDAAEDALRKEARRG